jgi:hypothetical protein
MYISMFCFVIQYIHIAMLSFVHEGKSSGIVTNSEDYYNSLVG